MIQESRKTFKKIPGIEFIKELRPVTFHFNISNQNKLEGIADSITWETKYDIEKFSGPDLSLKK